MREVHHYDRVHKGASQIGADPGGLGRSPPLKPTKVTLFAMIFHNAEINIRDVRSFCRPLFCYSSVIEVYFFPLTIAKALWDLTTKYYWNRPPWPYWLDPGPD